ncbi:hypothetical protein ACIBLB_29665 [Streptosporangium canum]|uniref:hypothetical protein n=1 Tax=Streptosporangium canum TaxID=324952 RepID=UPI00379FF9BD
MIVASLVAGGVALAGGPGAPGVSGTASAPDFSLTVSPARLVVPPGHLGDPQRFRVVNGGRSPVDIVVNRASFTADADGNVIYDQDAPHSAAGWLHVSPAAFHLGPGGRRRVTVRVDPPAEPENGEYRAALLFTAPAGPGAGNIRLNRAIGTPIYVTVPGPIDTSVRVGGLRAPDFAISGPVEFGATVENVGTVRRDFFGGEGLKVEVDGREIPFPDFTVLRGTSRDVTVRWTDPPVMCVCHAKVSVSGPDGTSSRSATVVVFPLHLFVMLLSVSGALYLLALWARRRCQARLLGIVRETRAPD